VGYVSYTGNMDLCIAIRTLVTKGDTIYVQAGAGVVAASVPAEEYQETVNKARAVLSAVEIARRAVHGAPATPVEDSGAAGAARTKVEAH